MGYYANKEVCYTLAKFLLSILVEFCRCSRSLLQKIFTNYIVNGRLIRINQYIVVGSNVIQYIVVY